MAHRAAVLAGLVLAIALPKPARADWPPAAGAGACQVTKETNVPARMRDGVILRADVYRPKTDKPVPVILMRTQYGKEAAQVQPARFQTPQWFSSHCYIVVIQDIRGQGASDGVFYEYANDRDDGYDTVEWAARLPGANGKVGMYGSSYVGATQWLAATAAPPSLKAIVPSNTASDYFDGWTYEDGAFRLAFIENWMAETIAESAAVQRHDTATAASLKAAAKEIARWEQFTPYERLPIFEPDNPVVAPYFFDAVRHSTDDDYWRAFSIESRYDKVGVPVLAFEGWYDAFLNGALRNFTGMRAHGADDFARQNQRIVIGPWEHLGWGRPESLVSPRLRALGPVADSPVNELTLAWFDHFLKGEDNGVVGGPRVDYFVMGLGQWRTARDWPLPGTRFQPWYLASGGHAASLMGDGVLTPEPPSRQTAGEGVRHALNEFGAAQPAASASAPTDSFVYDPANPVPSLGGHSCCAWTSGPQGQFDQSAIEQRADILVYSSPPLTEPLEVTGPITVKLYARTTAPDTDFTAKLIDVFPDGTAVNVANGVQRASFRESLSHPTPVTPGKVYAYEIHVWPTSNRFAPGHRIRLDISSSNFPHFDVNPNTGEPLGKNRRTLVVQNTVFHEDKRPSSVQLSLMPRL